MKAKNDATQEVELSVPLYDAAGTQTYTFTRFKYIMDFSGFSKLQRFSLSHVELLCNSKASGILLPPAGVIFHVRDSWITRPKDRGITSHGEGCQGMLIDRCQFLTDEADSRAQDRTSIVVNTNANDVKLRSNRATQFKHFCGAGRVQQCGDWQPLLSGRCRSRRGTDCGDRGGQRLLFDNDFRKLHRQLLHRMDQ